MPMNKVKGNMYGFVTHTWNAIRGKCLHDCSYCYMKDIAGGKAFEKEPYLEEKEFKTKLGSGNNIFIGSSTDMWGKWIPDEWIYKVLEYTDKFPDNQYLFQSKYPQRFFDFNFKDNTILCTTQETNRTLQHVKDGTFQALRNRLKVMMAVKLEGCRIAVTIEPIMDFDLDEFLTDLIVLNPEWIAIGANTSNKVKVLEPSWQKVWSLVKCLKGKGIKVHLKDNLKRLKTCGT